MDSMLKKEHRIEKLTNILTGTLLTIIALIFLVALLRPVNQAVTVMYWIRIGCTAVFTLGLAFFWYKAQRKTIRTEPSRKQMLAIFSALVIIHGIFGVAIMGDMSQASWDVGIVINESALLAHMDDASGRPTSIVGQQGYYSMYPNNAIITFILVVWYKIFHLFGIHSTPFITLLLTILFMQAALIMMWWVVRRFFGYRAALAALMVGVVFIVFSPWTRVFYTDTVGMFFPIAMLFFYLNYLDAASQRKKLIMAACLGISIFIGYGVKPTAIFMAVAIGVDILRRMISGFKCRSVRPVGLAIVVAIIAGLGCYGAAYKYIDKKIDIDESRAIPVSHFAMIGATKVCVMYEKDYCRYGGYNDNDWRRYLSDYSMRSRSDYVQYTISEIPRRIDQNGGLIGHAVFLLDKESWTLNDGTFTAYQEGDESRTPPLFRNNPVAHTVNQIVYPGGDHYKLFETTINVLWAGVMILVLCSALRPRNVSARMLIPALCIVLLLGFLAVFEARSRYLYLYLPIIIILSVYGAKNAVEILTRRTESLKRYFHTRSV